MKPIKVESHNPLSDALLLEEFNVKIKRMYSDYSKAIAENKYEHAIEIGVNILKELLRVTREYIISSLRTIEVRKIIEDILAHHEKNLGYVEGIEEAISDLPSLYSYEIRERAITTLSSSIQELFSFVLGALIVIADLYPNTNTSPRVKTSNNGISFI